MTPLVFLHGWGIRNEVFDDLAERLQPRRDVWSFALPGYEAREPCSPYALDAVVEDLAADAPARCVVAGWSLGGQIALRWALAKPEQVTALVLIATTPSFVQRDGWPHAVAVDVLGSFAAGLAEDRQGTLRRFASLQAQGDERMKAVALALRAALPAEADASTASLQQGLKLLLDTDVRNDLARIEQRALVVHGDGDRLVPHAAGEHIAATLARGERHLVRGAGHAPFLSRPAEVASALEAFLA